jgi:alpha-beta hydrolase superfamily lysophospholipase
MGGHSGRWDYLAGFFLKRGFALYAIELRGFGKTTELKGHVDSFKTYFNDIRSLREIIRQEYPKAKVFILGESFGGLLAFLSAAQEPRLFDGLICLSPLFKDILKYSFWDYSQVFIASVFNPKKQFIVRFNSSMCTRDAELQKILDTDEREHRLVSANLLVNAIFSQAQGLALKDKIIVPVLFLLAGRDMVVDSNASCRVFQGMPIKDKTLIEYPQGFHALSIDLDREKVFQDILKWVNPRLIK